MIQLIGNLKEYLKLTSNTHDSILEDMLLNAQSEVEAYCRQPIIVTGKYLTNLLIVDSEILVPFTVPVTVTKIEYRTLNDTSYVEVVNGEYVIYLDGSLMKINILNLNNIDKYIWRITASVGYSFENIPKEILKVIIEMAAKQFKNSTQGKDELGKISVSSTQSNTTSTNTYKDLYSEWYRILNKYRMITF